VRPVRAPSASTNRSPSRCERRWSDAHHAFAAVLEAFPEDGPAAYYRELSRALELRAPADWPGFVADPAA
jgi:hypothetical protein